jgi:hypothetical protein
MTSMSELATTSETAVGVLDDRRVVKRQLPTPLPLFFLGLGVVLSIAWGVVLIWLTLSAIVSIGRAFGAWVT